MPPFRLRLAAPAAATPDEAASSFYWLPTGPSSFTSTLGSNTLGPNLRTLGPVPDRSSDLVRIAATVFAADHSVLREARGSNWNRRDFGLEMPVSNAAAWAAVAAELEGVIAFLTGDHWKLSFNEDLEDPAPGEDVVEASAAAKRVVLLSGGADSAIGALVSRADLAPDERHVLLSHFSANTLAPLQRHIAQQAATLVLGPAQDHLQIHFARNQRRIDGTTYPTESSSRSRSLLFLALGLAAAAVHECPLWIPENGLASLNPPLGPERRGSLSTRTTHPAFLGGLTDVLHKVGAHGLIENPFAHSTKGEMFSRAAGLIGNAAASTFLSATNSCAHTGQRSHGISPATPCGVCFGCVVRRASFHASGFPDATEYIAANGDGKLQNWLDKNSVVPAVRSFVARGIRQRDLIALNLPPSYPIAQALDLCQRGVAELSEFVS